MSLEINGSVELHIVSGGERVGLTTGPLDTFDRDVVAALLRRFADIIDTGSADA